MPWDRSAIFREWISSALAPRPGFRDRSGWNLPDRQPPGGGNNPGHQFNCCLFGDNIDTTDGYPGRAPDPGGVPAEASSGYGSCLDVGVAGQTSRWQLSLSLPAGNPTAWPQGGRPIPGTGQRPTAAGPPGFQSTGALITFGGDNVTSAGRLTMNDVFGDFVFDLHSNMGTPVANLLQYQGLAFHYYGGPAGVTDGTFTVVWPAERVAQVQLAGISPSPPNP